MDSVINYDRVDAIKERIPKVFYYALFGELTSIFGPRHYVKLKYNSDLYEFDSGTGGWFAAVYMTCKKLNLDWLYKEWVDLPWYDSDTLDGKIEEELSNLLEHDEFHCSQCYYQYVMNQIYDKNNI